MFIATQACGRNINQIYQH